MAENPIPGEIVLPETHVSSLQPDGISEEKLKLIQQYLYQMDNSSSMTNYKYDMKWTYSSYSTSTIDVSIPPKKVDSQELTKNSEPQIKMKYRDAKGRFCSASVAAAMPPSTYVPSAKTPFLDYNPVFGQIDVYAAKKTNQIMPRADLGGQNYKTSEYAKLDQAELMGLCSGMSGYVLDFTVFDLAMFENGKLRIAPNGKKMMFAVGSYLYVWNNEKKAHIKHYIPFLMNNHPFVEFGELKNWQSVYVDWYKKVKSAKPGKELSTATKPLECDGFQTVNGKQVYLSRMWNQVLTANMYELDNKEHLEKVMNVLLLSACTPHGEFGRYSVRSTWQYLDGTNKKVTGFSEPVGTKEDFLKTIGQTSSYSSSFIFDVPSLFEFEDQSEMVEKVKQHLSSIPDIEIHMVSKRMMVYISDGYPKYTPDSINLPDSKFRIWYWQGCPDPERTIIVSDQKPGKEYERHDCNGVYAGVAWKVYFTIKGIDVLQSNQIYFTTPEEYVKGMSQSRPDLVENFEPWSDLMFICSEFCERNGHVNYGKGINLQTPNQKRQSLYTWVTGPGYQRALAYGIQVPGVEVYNAQIHKARFEKIQAFVKAQAEAEALVAKTMKEIEESALKPVIEAATAVEPTGKVKVTKKAKISEVVDVIEKVSKKKAGAELIGAIDGVKATKKKVTKIADVSSIGSVAVIEKPVEKIVVLDEYDPFA